MSSASRKLLVLLALLLPAAGEARELKVCADPNNLPFSNEAREGFENKVAEVIAGELGATLTYTWWAQRRGFFRNTLNAGLCDLVTGVPAGFEMTLNTRPWYRSTYVFVSRPDGPKLASLDDPRLRDLAIGVQLAGDDGANTPPVHALGERGLVGHLHGYSLVGNYAEPNPPARVVEAVARGDVDVALVWGPLAGWYAFRTEPKLRLAPIPDDGRLRMSYAIAMGVRKGDEALLNDVQNAIDRRRSDIDMILAAYHVPLLPIGAARPDEDGDGEEGGR